MTTCKSLHYMLLPQIAAGVALILAAFPLGAQSASGAQKEIALPEVTTVVSGDTLTAGKEAIPDFSSVLPTEESGRIELPTLEQVQPPAAVPSVSVTTAEAAAAEKNVYAEGQIGGGYPFLFLGDFSMYRATGDAPFSVTFRHRSSEDFARKKASDGFFSRNTAVTAEKAFKSTSAQNDFYAAYDTAAYGLQSHSTAFFDMVSHTISASESSAFELKDGWHLAFGADGNWYNRYGGTSNVGAVYDADGNSLDFDIIGVRARTTVLDVSPQLGFGWQNERVAVDFRASYLLQSNVDDGENFVKLDHAFYRNVSHRGEWGLYADYKTTAVTLHGDVSLVAGTAIGTPLVLFPFTLGADMRIPYAKDDERVVLLSVAGGLSSVQQTVRALEKAYRFAYSAALPQETSDWFCKGSLSIPFAADVFTVSASAEYRKSAFDNGVWTVDYTGAREADSGLYWLYQDTRTDFASALNAVFEKDGRRFSAGWEAHWLDIPALCERHSMRFELSREGERFALGASYKQALGKDSDKTPDVAAFASLRVSPTLRLALETNDIVKLLSNKTRAFAHSDYAAESGNAAFVVKFQF